MFAWRVGSALSRTSSVRAPFSLARTCSSSFLPLPRIYPASAFPHSTCQRRLISVSSRAASADAPENQNEEDVPERIREEGEEDSDDPFTDEDIVDMKKWAVGPTAAILKKKWSTDEIKDLIRDTELPAEVFDAKVGPMLPPAEDFITGNEDLEEWLSEGDDETDGEIVDDYLLPKNAKIDFAEVETAINMNKLIGVAFDQLSALQSLDIPPPSTEIEVNPLDPLERNSSAVGDYGMNELEEELGLRVRDNHFELPTEDNIFIRERESKPFHGDAQDTEMMRLLDPQTSYLDAPAKDAIDEYSPFDGVAKTQDEQDAVHEAIYQLNRSDPTKYDHRQLSSIFGIPLRDLRQIIKGRILARAGAVSKPTAVDPSADLATSFQTPFTREDEPSPARRAVIASEEEVMQLQQDEAAYWERRRTYRVQPRGPHVPAPDGKRTDLHLAPVAPIRHPLVFTNISYRGENLVVKVRETDGHIRNATQPELIRAIQGENPVRKNRQFDAPKRWPAAYAGKQTPARPPRPFQLLALNKATVGTQS